jgi:hypothetical protein
MSLSANAIFKYAFSNALGEGAAKLFSYGNNVSLSDLGKLGFALGQRFAFRVGNIDYIFRVGLFKAAGAEGDALKLDAPRTGTLASSTKAISTTASTYTESALAGGLITLTANTGAPATRFIKDNSGDSGASTVTVAERDMAHNIDATSTTDAWGTQPDATTTFAIYTPWEVNVSAAATDFIVGACLNTVSSGNCAIYLEQGPVMVKVIGAPDATTALGPLVPSATAGTLKGPTAAGITAVEASRVCGLAITAYGGAAALRLAHIQPRFTV